MNRFYQIHEFAEFAGVTVKALHHYDRLDLLKPQRTVSGYRMYAERDLERLEHLSRVIAVAPRRREWHRPCEPSSWRSGCVEHNFFS